MSNITGIRASGDIFAPQRAWPGAAARPEPSGGGNYGQDTVTLSKEACLLAQGLAGATDHAAGDVTADAAEARPGREKIAQTDTGADSSLKVNRKSIFALLMESLFLAEMEEADGGGSVENGGETAAPGTGASSGPLQDGETVARLKRAVNDFMTGKADLADLPKAMSVGKSSAWRGSAAPGGGPKGGETTDEII